MSKPHVILLPSWFPSHHHALNGVFIARQSHLLTIGAKVGVIYPDLRSARQLGPTTLAKQHFQMEEAREGDTTVIRQMGWNIPQPRAQAALFLWSTLRLLRQYIRRHGRPDLIHGHSVVWGGHAARIASLRLGIPYIITEHWSGYRDGELTPWQKEVARRALNEAAAVVSVSQALGAELAPYTGGRHVDVIPNPIDTSFFQPPPVLPPPAPFTVVSIANLNKVKQFDVLITAFAAAFGPGTGHSVATARLVIGGGGPQLGPLTDLAERLGVTSQIRFVGPVNQEGVRQVLHEGHVFVSTSLTETFGMAIAEAQATGLPVIATRSGGAEEILQTDTGILMEVGDVQTIARTLRAFQRREQPLKGHAEIRAGIVNRFEANLVAGRILALYDRVISNRLNMVSTRLSD